MLEREIIIISTQPDKAERKEVEMRKVNFEKVKSGDLVQVPRTQFAPMRSGWNGWLFSNAIVLRKAKGAKTGKPMIVVNMMVRGKKKNDYATVEKPFYAEHVFQTSSVKDAKKFMEIDGVKTKEEFYRFIQREDVTGCDWIKFLVDNGFLF